MWLVATISKNRSREKKKSPQAAPLKDLNLLCREEGASKEGWKRESRKIRDLAKYGVMETKDRNYFKKEVTMSTVERLGEKMLATVVIINEGHFSCLEGASLFSEEVMEK